MSATETFQRQFSVGRYEVVLSVQRVGGKTVSINTEWRPSMPRRLSPVLLKTYQQKRNHACAALAARVGGAIVMVDDVGSGKPMTVTTIYPGGRIEAVPAGETH